MKAFIVQHWKSLVYAACGVGLCWIDVWRAIGNGAQWALAVNCTGFCIFPMIALRLDWRMLFPTYRAETSWKKKFKISTYVWIVLALLFSYPIFRYLAPGTDYDAQIISGIANAAIYGAVLIRMYFYLFNEREERNGKVNIVFALWASFMILAIISVNKSVWPLWFMVMFGSLYLAPVTKEDMGELIEGLVNGLIIGFFWIQSKAFLYRPYDKDYRYYGHYTNPNVNAMFYLFTYVAWLIKLSFLRARKRAKGYAIALLFTSSVWVFVFFTGCRSAWMGFAGTTLVYLLIETKVYRQKLLTGFFCKGALILVVAAATFMPVYCCMRYIPPLRHHPVWYQAEYSEGRVMSWDPIDSEKYYELNEILPRILGRFYSVTGIPGPNDDEETEVGADFSTGHKSEITAKEDTKVVPIFEDVETKDTFLKKALGIRYFIYSYVLGRVTFFGNETFENVWISDTFKLYHAHNTVLMMLFWFGWIAGIVFLLLLLIVPIKGIYSMAKKESTLVETPYHQAIMLSILVTIAYLLVGITECVAFPGEMGLTLFFIALLPMIRVKTQNYTA